MRSGGVFPLSIGVLVWVSSPPVISAGSISFSWVKSVLVKLSLASPLLNISRMVPTSLMIVDRSRVVS